MTEPETKVEVVAEPEADHVSYTLDMPLETIQRLEREKAAALREFAKVPLAERINVEAEPAFGDPSKMATPALAAQPPMIGTALDGSRLVIPNGVSVASKVVEQRETRLVVPDRTAEAQAAQAETQAMPADPRQLQVSASKPAGAECSNRCDVRNGGAAFYHCHACQRHWRDGVVTARGPQRITVAG